MHRVGKVRIVPCYYRCWCSCCLVGVCVCVCVWVAVLVVPVAAVDGVFVCYVVEQECLELPRLFEVPAH